MAAPEMTALHPISDVESVGFCPLPRTPSDRQEDGGSEMREIVRTNWAGNRFLRLSKASIPLVIDLGSAIAASSGAGQMPGDANPSPNRFVVSTAKATAG